MITKKCSHNDPRRHGRSSNYDLREAVFGDPNILFCSECRRLFQPSKRQNTVDLIVFLLSIGGMCAFSVFFQGPWLLKTAVNALILCVPFLIQVFVIRRWLPWQEIDIDSDPAKQKPLILHVNTCRFCQERPAPLDLDDSSFRGKFVNPSVLVCDSCRHVFLRSREQCLIHAVLVGLLILALSLIAVFIVDHYSLYNSLLYFLLYPVFLYVFRYAWQLAEHASLRKLPWSDQGRIDAPSADHTDQ